MTSLKTLICLLVIAIQPLTAQVTLDANGPGDTYELISSVLAPGANPIETPDCGHASFGDHIDEVFDDELNTDVFRFFIHTDEDNDRCINFDRQRNEIKTYDQSPDNLLGVEEETVTYKWKFKLAEGFQPSPNFTHLHQLKSVGGDFASTPMFTLTARKSNPDRIELRYAETSSQTTVAQTPLAPLIGSWLDVTEIITYGANGSYSLVITKVADDSTVFEYENDDLICWQTGAEFVRPKWGIYRSLNNAQDLRDEEVRFANFSIEEGEPLSLDNPIAKENFSILSNRQEKTITVISDDSLPFSIKAFTLNGKSVLTKNVSSDSDKTLDVSTLASGAYIVQVQTETTVQSQRVLIVQ